MSLSIYTSFKYLQEWRLHHIPRKPVSVPEHPFHEEISPDIRLKPLWVQQVTGAHGKSTVIASLMPGI